MSEIQDKPKIEPGKNHTKLTPTLEGGLPGEPLYEHFAGKLPPDLPMDIYRRTLSCIGFSRLILEELGGAEKARIFYVDKEVNDEELGHAYVIQVGDEDSALAYNNTYPLIGILTVGEVKEQGVDITDEILGSPWEETS